MLYFLDTSALLKRYRAEKGTQTLDQIFSQGESTIAISALSISETASALNKHLRRREITADDFRKTLGRFYFELQKELIAIIDISRETFFKANDLIFEYHLTSSDALILATCITLRGYNPIFVCADTKSGLLYAAESCFISTLNPLSVK